MGCPTATQHMCPAVISRPLSSRASGLLSRWLETKAVPSQPRRRQFGSYTAACSTAQGRRLTVTAMESLAPQRIEIIEGSQLQTRPDSTNDVVLYTHMLCPYAQTALLTLLCKVGPPDTRLRPSGYPASFMPYTSTAAAGCAASGGAY